MARLQPYDPQHVKRPRWVVVGGGRCEILRFHLCVIGEQVTDLAQPKGHQSRCNGIRGSKKELSRVDVHHPAGKAFDCDDPALRGGDCGEKRAQRGDHHHEGRAMRDAGRGARHEGTRDEG